MQERMLHKDTTSKYSTDLSSVQIWNILNSLLFEILAPAVAHSGLSSEITLSCIAASTNGKRKISGLDQEQFISLCFTELILTEVKNSPETKIGLLNSLLSAGVERNIIYEYAQRCLVQPPIIPNADPEKYQRHVEHYIRLYDTFRRDVVGRFHNLTEFVAKRNHYAKNQHGLSAEVLEHYNVFTLSLMRAIDKFVPWRGTITSYILHWFENAKGASSYMVYNDEAFGLNRGTRKQVHDGDLDIHNKVIPLSDRENSIPDDSEQIETDTLLTIAKIPHATLLFFDNALPYYPKKTT